VFRDLEQSFVLKSVDIASNKVPLFLYDILTKDEISIRLIRSGPSPTQRSAASKKSRQTRQTSAPSKSSKGRESSALKKSSQTHQSLPAKNQMENKKNNARSETHKRKFDKIS